jgi:hypothetical protein
MPLTPPDHREPTSHRADRRTRAALLVLLLAAVLYLFFAEVLSLLLLDPVIRHPP